MNSMNKSLTLLFFTIITLSCQPQIANDDAQVVSEFINKLDSQRYNVGFLIMEGVYNTELTAPYDFFNTLDIATALRP